MNRLTPVEPVDEQRPDFIPAAIYHDRDLPRLERERLWPRVWQMACREEELVRVGDFVTYDILDDSILILRTGPGEDDIAAYYNVCQHRGRQLRDERRGHIGRVIACRFHGWQWTLDGQIAYVHAKDDWQGCPHFKDENLALPKVKVDRWGGWVWINQDDDAEPLESFLGEAAKRLDPFDPGSMRAAWWKTIVAPVNWKIICEAFNEGYHSWSTHTCGVNYRHASTPSAAYGDHSMFYSAPGAPPSEYKTENGDWKTAATTQENIWANNRHLYKTLFALTLEPGMAASERLLALPADTPPMEVVGKMFEYQREELEKRGAKMPEGLTLATWGAAGMDWHIFPNSIVLPSLDGALWYRVRPNGDNPDSCIFDIWSFGYFAPGQEPKVEQEIFQGFEAFRGQCAFLEEDFSNIEAVSKGVKSRGWKGARTNPVQEIPINHFREVLSRYVNDPI